MEYKYENGRIIPINNSISNKRLNRLEEVVKTLSPEGDILTQEDIEEVATIANNALQKANDANTNLNNFKNSIDNTYATKDEISELIDTINTQLSAI